MKKGIILSLVAAMIALGSFAQSQKLNRTNTRKKTNDTSSTVVLPTVRQEENQNQNQSQTGVIGMDGTVNDPANSGRNRSSTIDSSNAPALPRR